MKQYCRYCAHMCCGDANWCEKKEKCFSDDYIRRINNCKQFEFNEIDALDINKTYKPRKPKKVKQLNLFDNNCQ